MSQNSKADDKRTRILKASYEVFAEKGYEKASISEIVKRADIAKGTFYLYFESKASLPEALGYQLQEQMIAKVALVFQSKPEDLLTLFSKIIDTFYENAKSYGDVFDIIASEADIFNLDSVKTETVHPIVQPLLKEYQDKGMINPEVDLEIVMRLVQGVMFTLAHDLLVNKIDVDKEHYIQQTVMFLCRGLK